MTSRLFRFFPHGFSSKHFLSAIACLAAMLSGIPEDARAAAFSIDNAFDYPSGGPTLGDGHGCNLRRALQNSFTNTQGAGTECPAGDPAGDTITFAVATINQGAAGEFPFISGGKTVTMTGPVVINGTASDAIFVVDLNSSLTLNTMTLSGSGNRAVTLHNGSHLSAAASSFTNNVGAIDGAAILADGDSSLSISTSNFSGNESTTGSGGAISMTGSLSPSTISATNFLNNTAHNSGGAISFQASATSPAAVVFDALNFTGNTAHAAGGNTDGGGAMFLSIAQETVFTISGGTFEKNTVDGNGGRGGAIYSAFAGSPTVPILIDHCIFGTPVAILGNSVNGDATNLGGAIYSRMDMLIRASSFLNNSANAGGGGAIASDSAVNTTGVVVANSTIQGNSAALGAGVYSFGSGSARQISLINVTMDSNAASTSAGGGGIYNLPGDQGSVLLSNTIVSNNTANGSGDNCDGTSPAVTNVVTNLQWPGTTCSASAAITSGDPKLNAPSVNPPDVLTLTMSLQHGSAASEAGDNATCAAVPILDIDQRLAIRPAPGSTNCDIGAYESSNAPGYGSSPVPGSSIVMTATTTVPANSSVTISETGTDDLVISNFVFTGDPQITVVGPTFPATNFTIPDGGASQNLTLTCSSGAAGTFTGTLTVSHNAPGSPATYPVTCNVSLTSQTITFPNPGPQTFSGATIPIGATATSGLAVSFSTATPAVCSVLGTSVTMITIGTCTIDADQAGNGTYAAAPQVPQSFLINPDVPGAPTIGAATPGDTTALIAFTPPAFDGGSPITGYTMTCNPGAVMAIGAGSPINVTGLTDGTPYLCSVTATNIAGTGPPSGTVGVTPMVAATPPVITSANATTFTVGVAGTFNVTATGNPAPTIAATGALPAGTVTFTPGASPALLAGTPTAAGVFPLTFTATNGNAPDSVQAFTLTVNKGSQTIVFTNPGAQVFNALTVALSATAGSGLTVTFTTATPGVCSVAGNLVTKITIGTCTINADQAGDANWNAAPQVPQSFLINPTVPGAPTIGAATPGNTNATIAFTPPASNGGSPITGYTMTCNPGAIAATGAGSPIVVPGLANGTPYLCSVTATNIAGTGPPSGTVGVTPSVAPVAPLITSANATTFTVGVLGAFNVTATGTPAPTIAGTGALPGGVNFTAGASPAALGGTPTAAGIFPLTFTATNGTAPDAVQPFTLTVNKGAQTILFTNPGAQTFNASTVALTATSNSLLTVTFTTATPAVCSVAGNLVTKITIGTCTINADQAGDANWNAAAQVPQSFLINPTVPGAPTIGAATPGNATATIAFTPPASNGGSPITGYTMTCNPGAITATGAGSPIIVPGLANGTPYTCSVTATNIAGTGPPSGTVGVTPAVVTLFGGPSATGTGTINASFAGGGASCGYVTSQFIAAPPGAPPVPPIGVPGVTFPQGLFDFTVNSCTAGSTLTFTIVYPQVLPPGTQYYKYGPTLAQPAPHWYVLPATITGNTVTFSITDGGLGDDDLDATNGTIVDQGGPGVPAGAGAGAANAIPTLSEWALMILAMLLGLAGMRGLAVRKGT